MEQIKPSEGKYKFPRKKVEKLELRKRDLVIRIANWMRDKEEPAYDVEVYIGGVYDYNQSEVFGLHFNKDRQEAKQNAIAFAQAQIAKLL